MQQRLTLITLGVSDVQRARAFYENVFGWVALPMSDENVTFFKLNGVILSLFGENALAEDAGVDPQGHGFRKFSLAHNVRSEKEVDELIETLQRRGAKIIKSPQKVFWGGYSSYVADLDGNLWEIAYNPFLELDERGDVA